MPSSPQQAVAMVEEEEGNIRAIRNDHVAMITPPFERPIRAREYNVTVEMLSRVISDLSDGQVDTTFDKAKGTVEQLPPDVVEALQTVQQFTGDERFNPSTLAADPEAFADLAGVLSSMRSDDGRPKPKRSATATTLAQVRDADAASDAASIAGQLTPRGDVEPRGRAGERRAS